MSRIHQPEAEEHPAEHYRGAGITLMGVGGMGLVVSVTLVLVLKADLGFIDGQSMAAISSALFLTGLWMLSFGGKSDDI